MPPLATRFKPGDRVWYAGDITRPGSYSELHAVDERIVGPMPTSVDFAQAASLPLTRITAWELLFDRLRVQTADPSDNNVLLVIGAAGGVGSKPIDQSMDQSINRSIHLRSRPIARMSTRPHDVDVHGRSARRPCACS